VARRALTSIFPRFASEDAFVSGYAITPPAQSTDKEINSLTFSDLPFARLLVTLQFLPEVIRALLLSQL
jgi:hypothetical protein